jgi:hypothetical protein
MKRLTIALLFTLASLSASAADTTKSSVFIKSACDGKISAALVTSLKAEVDTSQKYHVVPNLTDEGRMDWVLTITVACSERTDIVAIATAFGKGKCFPGAYCQGGIDASSLKSTLCDSSTAVECGKTLFKTFDDYVSHMTSSGTSQHQVP